LQSLTPLGEEESIFSNPDSLEPEFIPPLLPYRENEIIEIAETLKALISGGAKRNLLLTGKAGIGKTHAVKKVLEEFREEENTLIFYVNCWTHPTAKEVFEEMASQIKLPKSPESTPSSLLSRIAARAEDRKIAICFDEIDKATEFGFLYSVLEKILSKEVILIANKKGFLAKLDERVRSRLLPKEIDFREYSLDEISGILKERRKFAFYESTWTHNAIEKLDSLVFSRRDIRFGLRLMRLAGEKAEKKASRTVQLDHVEEAGKELSF